MTTAPAAGQRELFAIELPSAPEPPPKPIMVFEIGMPVMHTRENTAYTVIEVGARIRLERADGRKHYLGLTHARRFLRPPPGIHRKDGACLDQAAPTPH